MEACNDLQLGMLTIKGPGSSVIPVWCPQDVQNGAPFAPLNLQQLPASAAACTLSSQDFQIVSKLVTSLSKLRPVTKKSQMRKKKLFAVSLQPDLMM